MKKALFIGGTGTISNAVSKRCLEKGWELYLLNRGNHPLPEGAKSLCVDVNDEEKVRYLLEDMHFDVVADFIISPSNSWNGISASSAAGRTNIFLSLLRLLIRNRPCIR